MSREPAPMEVNVLASGCVSRNGVQGAFAQNVFFRNGVLEVRQGFGQMNQFDTSVSQNFAATDPNYVDWGYRKHLGSRLIHTDFGNLQLVSVFLTTIRSGSLERGSIGATVYAVSIYDIDQNTRWEEIIYRQASEGNHEKFRLPFQRTHYETSGQQSVGNTASDLILGYDYQDWISAKDENFYFYEYRDILFFGNSVTGLMAYRPCLFGDNTEKFVNLHDHIQWTPGTSESAVVTRAIPSKGLFQDGLIYFTKDEFPKPSAIIGVEGRLVYASGKSLYFSDAGFPTNIAADNYITIEAESDITALAEVQGNIVVFTENETWMYHPSTGFLYSQGRLQRISDYVGCVGPTAVKRVGGKIWWWDRKGIYSTTGNTLVEHESAAIDNYWRGIMTSPVSHYHTAESPGFVDNWTTRDHTPGTSFRYSGGPINITHDSLRNLIIFSIPDEDIAWVLCDNGQWCLWNFESFAYSEDDGSVKVNALKNITYPWIESKYGRVYLVGGPETQDHVDDAVDYTDASIGDDVRSSSYYILEYGRGGGIDRNTYEDESTITVAGKYKTLYASAGDEGTVYLDKWIPFSAGFTGPQGAVASWDGYLVPVYISFPPEGATTGAVNGGTVDRIRFDLFFDHTKWRPLCFNANGEIDILVPPDRIASIGGYSQGSPTSNARFQVYDTGSTTYITAGDSIRVRWDGLTGSTWSHAPFMPDIQRGRKALLAYIPMQRMSASDGMLSGMGWSVEGTALLEDTGVTSGAASSEDCGVVAWEQFEWDSDELPDYNAKAQPVDWIYKTDNINEDEALRVQTRGIFLRTLSHGDGDPATDDTIYPYFAPKLLGVALAADGREYLAQAMAYTEASVDATLRSAELLSREIRTIQPQIRHTDDTLTEKTFFNSKVTAGDITDNSIGTYFIDDEEVMDQLVSANMVGNRLSYILYGATRHRGHRLVILQAKAAISVRSEYARRVDRRVT